MTKVLEWLTDLAEWALRPFVVVAVVVFAGVGVVLATLPDDGPRPTPEQDDAAYAEWQKMDLLAREIVCNMFEDRGEAIFFPSQDSGLTAAKVDLMERECK